METYIKDKIVIVDGDSLYLDMLIRYKLSTIMEYADDISVEERKRIEAYVLEEVPKMVDKYKILIYEGKVVGAYLVEEREEGLLLDEIYIEEEYRGQGIGKRIINSIINSNNKVYLWVYKKNVRAIKLYEEVGFKIDKETETRYYMKKED